jgi:hypothetical protein
MKDPTQRFVDKLLKLTNAPTKELLLDCRDFAKKAGTGYGSLAYWIVRAIQTRLLFIGEREKSQPLDFAEYQSEFQQMTDIVQVLVNGKGDSA